uniref:unconventional myosin-XIX isoform X3 n=1 Tax=Podarcis muralis TaxID=64176 RepID=UPI00109F5BF4|nr:unconventional myosin-XIX isoform X3 [Podarcis muralis]
MRHGSRLLNWNSPTPHIFLGNPTNFRVKHAATLRTLFLGVNLVLELGGASFRGKLAPRLSEREWQSAPSASFGGSRHRMRPAGCKTHASLLGSEPHWISMGLCASHRLALQSCGPLRAPDSPWNPKSGSASQRRGVKSGSSRESGSPSDSNPAASASSSAFARDWLSRPSPTSGGRCFSPVALDSLLLHIYMERVNGTKSHPATSCEEENGLGEDVKSFLGDERQLHCFDDLTKVNPVTTTTVLKCLQARYAIDVFYTNAGSSLVAVNPFRPIPRLYSLELMRDYHTAPHLQELKPHVFVVAEETYRNVQSQIPPVNQSIIVSGESGAGKTWTSRCLMKFYATVASSSTVPKGSVAVERIEKRVLDSNPVMEAFGNACTLRNSNSSRFGKYIQLQLNRSHHLTSASIQTFLLEKTRVAYQAPCERNFHIFYQIAKGASHEERLEWDVPEGAKFCWLPNPEKTLEEDSFEVTREAMSHLGIDCYTQNNVFKILAGLLHLGNIQFSEAEDESQPCELDDSATGFAKTASRLLKVPVEQLLETLRIRTITAGKQRQVFKKACPKVECGTRRDCLAKVVYAKVFDWLVAVINGSINADPSVWSNFIGLLDVYGFESFPDNHLEQLCINYANEKLQQHFVGHFLKAQQEEYAAEGLEWSFINYQDNQCCLDVIEGSPVSIFSLLNEECRLNRPSNTNQLQTRIDVALSDNRCVSRDRFSKEPNFIVSHYAGDVRYQVEGMVEKNKDPVPPELVLLLQLSQDSLLQKLFPVETTSQKTSTNEIRTQMKPVVVTVVSKFKGSLEKLMEILHSTTPHYIRCIKPNADCQAALFRKDEVLQQLEACGIVEAVNISAAGFPIRISFESFMERYKVLRSPKQKSNTTHQENGFSHVMGNAPPWILLLLLQKPALLSTGLFLLSSNEPHLSFSVCFSRPGQPAEV